jgi:hypothetical protein
MKITNTLSIGTIIFLGGKAKEVIWARLKENLIFDQSNIYILRSASQGIGCTRSITLPSSLIFLFHYPESASTNT